MVADTDLSARDYKERFVLGDDAKAGYVVDAGINVLYTAAWYRFDVRPARLINAPAGALASLRAVVHGDRRPSAKASTCRRWRPAMSFSLHPVGAYNVVQSMQFISYRPAVVLIAERGKPG